MKKRRGKIWDRKETLIAFNLYSRMPYGQIHDYDPRVRELARLLKRPDASVAMKLCNLASYDPEHLRRGIKSLSRPCKTERRVWDEFQAAPSAILSESARLLAELKRTPLESAAGAIEPEIAALPAGEERKRIVNARVNQALFRQIVIAAYGGRCCMTGVAAPQLLNASHIVPWRCDPAQRLNPKNGLCLNALHDRAFDRGLITVTVAYKVKVSDRLLAMADDSPRLAFVADCDGQEISLPDKFLPERRFLNYHRRYIFDKIDPRQLV